MFSSFRIPSCAVFILAIFLLTACSGEQYDIVISDGRVIDPETGLDALKNVGIVGNEIVAITSQPLRGTIEIDAQGLVVAPGFVDLHAHGMTLPDMRMQVMQGVTTILELESGILPVGDWYTAMASEQTPVNYGASAAWTFARIAAFSGQGPEATAGYFQAAQARDDWKNELADDARLADILSLVNQGLEEGALGIGINAGYAPGYGRKEYFALAELANTHDVATFTHVRYASNIEPQSSFEALQELIANAAITGARMHICHLNSIAMADMPAALSLVDQAIEQGIPITVEAYPYAAGNTVVGAAMFTGAWRDRMNASAQNFQLGSNRLSEEELADMQANDPGTFITFHFLDEENPDDLALLDAAIAHPQVMIASDSVFWAEIDENGLVHTYTGADWPLPENVFSHPRSAGAFAKVLRDHVRERGLISLPDAIEKMTLMPVSVLEDFVPQMRRKGRLQVGMDADIVVFDPDSITDEASYAVSNRAATGVDAVLVNGAFAVRDGALVLDANSGEAIRR